MNAQDVRNAHGSLRLYALDTGLIECADYAMFSPDAGPDVRQDMSVRSYLIVHPRGVLLWDTGIDDTIANLPGGQRRITDAIVFRVPVTLRAQLAEIGVDPADVDFLGMSHLHIDHVGNAGLFPDAAVVMQRAERDAAYGPDAERLTYIPDTYVAIARERIQTVTGEHDVFGDGSVVMTPLPGHTPGHQGLIVHLQESGPILLAGDIAYSARDYASTAVRPSNVDLEQSRLSIEAARRMEHQLGATIWLHHDLDGQRAVRTAPECYE